VRRWKSNLRKRNGSPLRPGSAAWRKRRRRRMAGVLERFWRIAAMDMARMVREMDDYLWLTPEERA